MLLAYTTYMLLLLLYFISNQEEYIMYMYSSAEILFAKGASQASHTKSCV